MLRHTKAAASIAFLVLSAGCEASPSEAVSYDKIELRLPQIEQVPANGPFPDSYDARLRLLLDDLEMKAVGEFGGQGLKPVVEREQVGDRGQKILLYIASSERAVAYILPFFGLVQSDVISGCRFEFDIEDMKVLPRAGSYHTLAALWPGENCEPPNPDMTAISEFREQLAHDGYRVFTDTEMGNGQRAAVIEHPESRDGEFDIEAALDRYAGANDPIIQSVALPMFRWRSGTADTVSGRRLYYLDSEPQLQPGRRYCIVEGVSWDEFRDWKRRDKSHPLKSFCDTELRRQSDVHAARLRESYRDSLPPRTGPMRD